MEFGVLQAITYFFKEVLSLIINELDVILAFILFIMSYKLFKIALDKADLTDEPQSYRKFAMLCFPAVFISLFGVVFVINLDQINLLIMFLFGSLITGISFAVLGYKLFIKGVFESSDIEATWKDRSLLLKKASPGTIFGLFGVAVIVFSLWKGTSMVNNLQTTQAATNKEVISAIDRNVPEVLKILKQYLDPSNGENEKDNSNSDMPSQNQ